MLAVNSIQAGPNTDLSWILFVLLGVFLFVIIIGAFTSREKPSSASGPAHETRRSSEKAIKTSTGKKSRK